MDASNTVRTIDVAIWCDLLRHLSCNGDYINPSNSGYVFRGWFEDEAYTTPYVPTERLTTDKDIYAKWETASVDDFCLVTWNANGGYLMASGGDSDTKTEIYAEGSYLVDPIALKNGYTFEGWYREATFENKWNFETDSINSDITLYAKWVESGSELCTVTFELNGGTPLVAGTLEPVEVVKGSELSTLFKQETYYSIPERSGYKFIGWYKDAAFTELCNKDYDTVTEDMVLYAAYEEASSLR